MSLPAASLSAFFASSLSWLYPNLLRRVGEDVEAGSTMGFMGEALGTAKEAAGNAKEGTRILARKEGWYCQGRKLGTAAHGLRVIAKDGSSGPRKLGYCQRWKLRDKEVQTWAGRVFAFLSAGADTKANTMV